MVWLFAMAVSPSTPVLLNDWLVRAGLGLLGFTWVNLYMLIHIYRMFGTLVPSLMTFGFFAIDLPMTLFGIMFSAVIHVLVHWVGRGLHFVFRNGVRRVLLVITLPCLILGLFLKLSATFF